MKCWSALIGRSIRSGDDVRIDFSDKDVKTAVMCIEHTIEMNPFYEHVVNEFVNGREASLLLVDMFEHTLTSVSKNNERNETRYHDSDQLNKELQEIVRNLILKRSRLLESIGVGDFNIYNKECGDGEKLDKCIIVIKCSGHVLFEEDIINIITWVNNNLDLGLSVLVVTRDGDCFNVDLEKSDFDVNVNIKYGNLGFYRKRNGMCVRDTTCKFVFYKQDNTCVSEEATRKDLLVVESIVFGSEQSINDVSAGRPIGLLIAENRLCEKSYKQIIKNHIIKCNKDTALITGDSDYVLFDIVSILKERLKNRPEKTKFYVSCDDDVNYSLVKLINDFGYDANIAVIFVSKKTKLYYSIEDEDMVKLLMGNVYTF